MALQMQNSKTWKIDDNVHADDLKTGRKRTLGNVRLRDHRTNEIILIPTPSADPNDPLNWYVCPCHIFPRE
jgi:hypothetical protein